MATVKLWSSIYNSYLVPYVEAVRDRTVVYEALAPYVKEASQESILFITIALIATALIVVISLRNAIVSFLITIQLKAIIITQTSNSQPVGPAKEKTLSQRV